MTPGESLKFLQPAFKDLFEKETPDLSRFLRLVIDVFDPDPGYGPMMCHGDGTLLPRGCGTMQTFRRAMANGNPYGYLCPNCKAIFPWSFVKGNIKKVASRIVLTSDGSSTIGHCRVETDSGIVLTD